MGLESENEYFVSIFNYFFLNKNEFDDFNFLYLDVPSNVKLE